MPAEIINLRRARKKRDRAQREADAAAKRALFGQTKVEKTITKAESEAATRKFDAHRREEED